MKFDMSETGQSMLQLQDDLAKQYGYKVQPPLIAQENIRKYYDELPEDFKMGELISNLKGGGMAFDVKKVWDSFAHGIAGSFDTHGNVEEGYETDILPLYSLSGTKIADRYDRVVIGQYGAFIEIDPKDMCMDNIKCEKGQEYRINNPYYASRVKYQWFTTDDDTHTKLYNQQRGVTYADYQPNRWYVSPYEVCTEEQIMKLRGFDKMYSFDTLDEEGKHPFYRDNFYFNSEVGEILHTTWDFVEGTMFEEEKISDTRFAEYIREAEDDNHTVLYKAVEIIGNAIPEADGYMQFPIPVNTHGELYTDKNGNSIFLDGQGGVLVNGIPVPPETIVYDPNDPTRPLYKPELAGRGQEQGQTQGTELEIFSYSYEHHNGDQYWTDYSKYIFKTDTEEIIKNYSDGYTLEEGTTVVPKDKFLEVVDTVEREVRSNHEGYEIYNRLSDSNRALIERLLKQEQAREMRTFNKTDIPHDKPQKETARLATD